jgi:hypothetical protein
MRKLLVLLAGAALTAPAAGSAHHAATLTLFRAHCGLVAAVASQRRADAVAGSVAVAARPDPHRGSRAVRVRVDVAVQHGMANAAYQIRLLRPGCGVQATRGTLVTDAHGAGRKSVEVARVRLPAGRYAVQLLASAHVTSAGTEAQTDVLTTRFRLLVPAVHDVRHDVNHDPRHSKHP